MKSFLTLNIGAANIELAEYAQGAKGGLTLLKYGKAALAAPLDGGNAATILAPALLELVREHGFKPGKVAMSISGQMVFPKFAAIPMAGGDDKFEQLIRYEIEQNIPFPIDEMVCDRQVLGETENGDRAVMIVAAKVDQVEELTAAVQSAGFTPELIDAAPLAVTNVARFNREGDESCIVVLDIGAKTTSLVIVEGDKVYNRSIPVAGNQLTKEIAAALGCSLEEAETVKIEKAYISLGGVTEDEDEVSDRLAKVSRAVMTRLQAEITRSVNFYRSQQHGGAPVALYLTGGSALLPQLDQFFADALGIEVAYLNPFERIGVAAGIDEEILGIDGAQLAATAGLAVHLVEHAHFNVNLLPPSLTTARAERARLPFLVVGGIGIAAALLLVALALNRQASVIEAQRDAVQGRLSALTDFDKRIAAESQKLATAQSEADAFRQILLSKSSAVIRLLAARGALMPGMWISSCSDGQFTVRYWKDKVAGAGGKTAAEIVVAKLSRHPMVASASIRSSTELGSDTVVLESVKDNQKETKQKETVKQNHGQVEQFTVEVKFK